jgi:hypothetical protein
MKGANEADSPATFMRYDGAVQRRRAMSLTEVVVEGTKGVKAHIDWLREGGRGSESLSHATGNGG